MLTPDFFSFFCFLCNSLASHSSLSSTHVSTPPFFSSFLHDGDGWGSWVSGLWEGLWWRLALEGGKWERACLCVVVVVSWGVALIHDRKVKVGYAGRRTDTLWDKMRCGGDKDRKTMVGRREDEDNHGCRLWGLCCSGLRTGVTSPYASGYALTADLVLSWSSIWWCAKDAYKGRKTYRVQDV